METEDRNIVNSAIHGGSPLRSYIKTILGKVYVTVWDSFEGMPAGVILSGDPRKEGEKETCIIDIWTDEEDFYFRSKNKRHLQTGNIIPYTRVAEAREKTLEEFSDPELKTIINQKFLAFQHSLNSTESVAVLFRIRGLAEEMEKSDKIIKAIEARISEVQAKEYEVKEPSVTEL